MRRSFLLLSLLLTGLSLQAQVEFGPKMGLNWTRAYLTDNYEPYQAKLTVNAGVFVDAPLGTQGWGLLTGLEYNRKGERERFSDATFGQRERITIRRNYVALPLMARYRWENGIGIFTGPQVGVLVSANTKVEIKDLGETVVDNKDDLNPLDLSWGIGLQLITEKFLWFDVRAQFSLTDFIESDQAAASNQLLQFNVLFPLGREIRSL